MYEPLPSPRQSHSQNKSKTLPGPRPSRLAASTVAHRGPRRDQLLDHGGMAVHSRVMQRRPASGAEDATRKAGRLRLPWRNKAYSHGMFLQVVGQDYRSEISDPPSWYFLYVLVWGTVRHGEKQEEQSSQICSCSIVLFKSYQQLHLTFAASSVACLETISWIPLDYPNADKPFSQVKK